LKEVHAEVSSTVGFDDHTHLGDHWSVAVKNFSKFLPVFLEPLWESDRSTVDYITIIHDVRNFTTSLSRRSSTFYKQGIEYVFPNTLGCEVDLIRRIYAVSLPLVVHQGFDSPTCTFNHVFLEVI